MSKTYCRFCDITVKGLYLNCPRCGKYLAPYGEDTVTPPEAFEIDKWGDTWEGAM